VLIRNLGRGYVVWDKAASIRFVRPGRTTLSARFLLDGGELDAVRAALEHQPSIDRTYRVDLVDREGVVHATAEKLIYVRRRRDAD
jgi:hypothetical protein